MCYKIDIMHDERTSCEQIILRKKIRAIFYVIIQLYPPRDLKHSTLYCIEINMLFLRTRHFLGKIEPD